MSFRENEKWFPYQRLGTYPRFKPDARGNPEMAYFLMAASRIAFALEWKLTYRPLH